MAKKLVPLTTQAGVTLAELALKNAKERAEATKRADDVKQLKAVRAELRTKRAAFDKLAKRIMQGQEDLNAVYANQTAVIAALGRLQDAKPEIADFLPNEPEVLEWKDNVRILTGRLEKLKAARLALPNVELLRIEAVQLRERIQQLQYAESNCLHRLDGTVATTRPGGVFAPS